MGSKRKHKSNSEHRRKNDKLENFPDGYTEPVSSKSRAKTHFNHISIILTTNDDYVTNTETSYKLRFSNGILDGKGIDIGKSGDTITFASAGSYKFELSGESLAFTDPGSVYFKIYSTDFNDEIGSFGEIKVPQQGNTLLLHGLSTLLPIKTGQQISLHLIPEVHDSIVVKANTRLIIHRVA